MLLLDTCTAICLYSRYPPTLLQQSPAGVCSTPAGTAWFNFPSQLNYAPPLAGPRCQACAGVRLFFLGMHLCTRLHSPAGCTVVLLCMCSPMHYAQFFPWRCTGCCGQPQQHHMLWSLPMYRSCMLHAAFPHDTRVCNRHASMNVQERLDTCRTNTR